ncbi:MAG: HAD family hydrolase [Candidatus Competibacterales bacterium]
MTTSPTPSRREPVELVIFDWDGTLVDSIVGIVASVQAAVAELGWPPREDETIATLIGLDWQGACRVLYPDQSPADHVALAKAARRHNHQRPAPAPFPGADTVLQSLRDCGCRLAVATSKPRTELDGELPQTGLGPWITASRTADETAPKPDPKMLVELLAALDTPPHRALMVGDSEYDLTMAARAGLVAVAANYGVHGFERLARCRPAAHIDQLAELPSALARCGFINL